MKNFKEWKHDLIQTLNNNSSVIETTIGPIEYTIAGDKKNPIVAVMHGAPGGYDQCAIENNLINHGFCVLAWSRPGYLRTPLSVGKTFEEQAGALIALLDALDIKHVAVLSISAGGAPALYTAIKYPDRVWALISEVALSQRYTINRLQSFFVNKLLQDRYVWLLHKLYKKSPKLVLKLFLFLEGTFDKTMRKEVIQRTLISPESMNNFSLFLNTMSPMSIRKQGTLNDLNMYTILARIPIEKIQTPTLIIQGNMMVM